jgi:hypothetical protein
MSICYVNTHNGGLDVSRRVVEEIPKLFQTTIYHQQYWYDKQYRSSDILLYSTSVATIWISLNSLAEKVPAIAMGIINEKLS